MSRYRSGDKQSFENRSSARGPSHWRDEQDDDFYNDRYSPPRSRRQRYGSPARRRSPLHAASRPLSRERGGDDRSSRSHNRHSDPRGSSYARDHHRRNRTFSPSRDETSYRHHDDTDMLRNYTSRSRSRSRSPKSSSHDYRSRKPAPPPNKEIMIEGLSKDMTEEDIKFELEHHYRLEGLTDVRVIRDRQTKQSRQFGFLRFGSLDEAQSFLERNDGLLYLFGTSTSQHNEAAKIRMVYSRERHAPQNNDGEGEWICKICTITNKPTRVRCFRCQAYRADGPSRDLSKPMNVGDNDASPDNTPSQFLLFRGLEPSSSEDIFLKGVSKLYKPSSSETNNHQSAKRGVKVASTTGDGNLGAKEGSLRRVLLVRDRHTNESWRFGFAEYASVVDAKAALTRYNSFEKFTIASKPVLVSYVHSGVFVPASSDPHLGSHLHFSPLGNPSMKIAYWDDEAYVAELKASNQDNEDVENVSHKHASATSLNNGKENSKAKKRKADPSAMDMATTKKATPSYLQRWSNQHAELHGLEPKTGDSKASGSSARGTKKETSELPEPLPPQSFADPERHCCYLCSRQFQSATDVNKHERLSNLHQSNLLSENLVSRARTKLMKHGIASRTGSEPGIEYRDRARERRRAFGVVNKKGQQVQPSKSEENQAGIAMESMSAAANDTATARSTSSKGAALLGKMGYVAGTGLGASGAGTTAPIAQDVYVSGVGLGAEGGKVGDALEEAERNTKGDYGGFLAKTKEGARQRYERMS